MEDMERYGDYNEIDAPPSKNPVVVGLKILVVVVCFAVIGLLLFRIILFNYYPSSMTKLYFNDVLTEHYNAKGGSIAVKTQEIRFPYDDPDRGNFFCDNLFVIEEADQLQVSLRFNDAVFDTFKQEYGVDISELGADAFRFSLVRDPIEEKGDPIEIAAAPDIVADSLLMYRYYKLVFDGVDFGLDEGENKVEWIRLEIELLGAEKKTVFAVPVYENNESFSSFDDYKLSAGERPQ